jgi:hypothetical protein
MKEYFAYKNSETGVNYIPFYKLTSIIGSKKEFTPFITNGIITIQLTPEREKQCQIISVTEQEFNNMTKGLTIKEIQNCTEGNLFENYGYIFTLELNELSDEYMKSKDLIYKTRSIQHNPIYSKQYGSISAAWLY